MLSRVSQSWPTCAPPTRALHMPPCKRRPSGFAISLGRKYVENHNFEQADWHDVDNRLLAHVLRDVPNCKFDKRTFIVCVSRRLSRVV
jgi:hypothetical protein